MIEDMLADLGCEFVIAAAEADNALAAIDAKVIDVLDVNLNGSIPSLTENNGPPRSLQRCCVLFPGRSTELYFTIVSLTGWQRCSSIGRAGENSNPCRDRGNDAATGRALLE
jgi:hypothetical protein